METKITWNDVKNGFPKSKGWYLITVAENTTEAFYNTKCKSFTGRDGYVFENVIALAEMPGPYKRA